MLPTPAILAAILVDESIKAASLTPAKKALHKLRHILSYPADTEYNKVLSQKSPDRGTPTTIHSSWTPLLPNGTLPVHRPRASRQPSAKPLRHLEPHTTSRSTSSSVRTGTHHTISWKFQTIKRDTNRRYTW